MTTEDTLKTSTIRTVYYCSTYADSFCDEASESDIKDHLCYRKAICLRIKNVCLYSGHA